MGEVDSFFFLRFGVTIVSTGYSSTIFLSDFEKDCQLESHVVLIF